MKLRADFNNEQTWRKPNLRGSGGGAYLNFGALFSRSEIRR
jgi:hypothetical protein